MFSNITTTPPDTSRGILKMFQFIGGILIVLLSFTACDTGKQTTSTTPSKEGPIPDWPEAVQKAIAESPEYELGAFDAGQQQSFLALAQRAARLDPDAEAAAETGSILAESARELIATALPEREPVVAYKLTGSIYCQLATPFISLTESGTELAEAWAKMHAFNNGNEYSWPGFIQAVWADVAADRALWAAENGSTAQDAQEAIDELDLVIWHAGEAINFELQSYAVTGDYSAQSSASMLESAATLAVATKKLLAKCKATL